MKMKWISGTLLGLVFFIKVNAQERTVGLIRNDPEAYEGYTLFSPMSYTTAYLINNKGELVHSWESEYKPGYMAYLSQDGYLYRTNISGVKPGSGGIEKIDWDGNVVWNYYSPGDDYFRHHDIAILPSGNVLMIALEIKDSIEAIQAGANPQIMAKYLHTENIIEVKPNGLTGGDLVWQWHAWDHLVQDYDSTRDNFGVVRTHPELINLNAENPLWTDFIHLNAISYDERLDQILLTSRIYNEVWVIDHGITTDEAKGHTAGRYGRGGDLLYRWGNPAYYGYGNAESQKLFYPHAGNWIDSGSPGAGNMLIFNNGSSELNRPYSSVDEVSPPVNQEGKYLGGLPYGPDEPLWSWSAPEPEDFFFPFISGAQRLPNGNTLICDGYGGKFFEVSPEGKEVWCYVNPVTETGPVRQGTIPSSNAVFKIVRYAPDYPGFAGRDLDSKGPIELAGVVEIGPTILASLDVQPSIFRDVATISYLLGTSGNVSVKIYDALGREMLTLASEVKAQGSYDVRWGGVDDLGRKVNPGVYFVVLIANETVLKRKIAILR